jgi:UDP-glucose 4-epimerase
MLALSALMDGSGSNVFNLGNSKRHSVRQVVELSGKITGRSIPAKEAARRAGDPAVLTADSGKIRKVLGWQPAYEDLEEIIESAWRWHKRQPMQIH